MLVTDINHESEVASAHDNSFPLPNLNNKLYISKKQVISNGQLIAAGFVRLTCEGIVVVDLKQPLVSRVEAIKKLIEIQSEEARKVGLQDCHVFVKNDSMANLLRQLGFIELTNEIPMMVKL